MVRRWCPVAGLVAVSVAVAQPLFPQAGPGSVPAVPPPVAQDQAKADKTALAAARLSPDDPDGLIAYLKQRTLTDTDLTRMNAVIRRLGAEPFDERVKAAGELVRIGPAAVAPLRAALSDSDPEIAFRAGECLQRLQTVPHPAVAAAVVRALAAKNPPGAAAALLGFLPSADDVPMADDIRAVLAKLAVRDGTPNPELVAGLADPAPARRAAAAVALLTGGVKQANVVTRLRQSAQAETDPDARFQVLFALASAAGEKTAVASLIGLLPDLPRGRFWQAEDFLLQLAGPNAPKAVFGRTPEAKRAATAAWAEWWKAAEAKTDLISFKYTPRTAGCLVTVQVDAKADPRFGGGVGSVGAVIEYGPDLTERWRLAGLGSPLDARIVPEGVVIAEQISNSLTFRTPANRLLAARFVGVQGPNPATGVPQQIHLLDTGNLLVVCRNLLVEYTGRSDKVVLVHTRMNYDIAAACRLPDGRTFLYLFDNSQGGNAEHMTLLDKSGQELPDRPVKVAAADYAAMATATGPDRVLLTEPGRLAEYDLKAGKAVWTRPAAQPRCAERLANGNTLFVETASPSNRVVEVAPSGEEVWSFTPPDPNGKGAGMQVWRAYRR
ncbi:MAG: hypothetical protein U0871_11640 [Gemmataceae bacterium]